MGRFNLDGSVNKAVSMLQELMDPDAVSADNRIPLTLLRHCEAVAFVTIVKAGLFMLAGNMGGGCIICKVPDDTSERGWRWSGPSSLGVGGLGGGFVFGGEKIDSLILLNTKSSVRAFMGKGQVTFGGSLSLAVGPVGRDVAGNVGVSDTKEVSPAYSYSRAKGAYIGATLDGAVILSRPDDNASYYKRKDASPEAVLGGTIPCPPEFLKLAQELDMIIGRKGRYAALESARSQTELAGSGRDLLKSAMVVSDLPPGWEEAKTDDGKVYYFNTSTNKTQWDKPVATPPPPAIAAPKAPPPPPVASRPASSAALPPRPKPTVTAKYDYTATQADELTIKVGEKFEIVDKSDPGWWKVKSVTDGKVGMVPSNYIG